jgi:hypothetical protein
MPDVMVIVIWVCRAAARRIGFPLQSPIFSSVMIGTHLP